MKTLHLVIIVISLIFIVPSASAHLIPSFSVQPDQNYTDPVTHYMNTKEGHPHIVITRDSEFTLPMTLKSENDSRTTSYLIHVTDGNNFTAETMPPGVSIRVMPNHFITSNGTDQKFNIVIKVDKNASSGVYEPNLVIKWNDNVTQSMEISSISFQVGKWNWDSLSKQVESGISKNHVVCKSSIQIVVLKSEDGSPACVQPDTAQKLIERGWGNTLTPTAWFRYTILDPFESGSNAHQDVPWSNYIPANVSDTAYNPWFNGTAIKEYFTSHGVTLLAVRYSSNLLAGPEGVGTPPQRQTDFYFLTLQNDTSQMNQFGFKMINVDPRQDLSVLGQILPLNN